MTQNSFDCRTLRIFLHVGCGRQSQDGTTRGFADRHRWREIRLDIDPEVRPDIVASMLDMSAVADGSMDAIFSSHNLEHLHAHEVPVALREFHRVLKDDGFAIITCPDVQSVAELVAQGKLLEPCYISPSGPIAPIDILWGHRPSIGAGNVHMAHRTGFTMQSLRDALQEAGFGSIMTCRRPAPAFDLWAVASKNRRTEADMRAIIEEHFTA